MSSGENCLSNEAPNILLKARVVENKGRLILLLLLDVGTSDRHNGGSCGGAIMNSGELDVFEEIRSRGYRVGRFELVSGNWNTSSVWITVLGV